MEGVDAFHSEVIAYPAITVISRSRGTERADHRSTRVAKPGGIRGGLPLPRLVAALQAERPDESLVTETRLDGLGNAPWLLDDLSRLGLIRRLEQAYPTLEQAGCKVGIGVATGCDRVFIGDYDQLPVESDRKLPLVMAGDLTGGGIAWSGRAVLNPFRADGGLVALEDYPRLAAYLREHHTAVASRHVATRNPNAWYRTIDRIDSDLVGQPKLLIPDIKGEATCVLDAGRFYPHHNLYYITSTDWDLRALQTVLRSSLAVAMVATYCTRMAGGFLRFQAQYLRRIRIPRWADVPADLRQSLADASEVKDQDAVDEPVFRLYGLSEGESRLARAMSDEAQVTVRRRANPS